MYNVLHLMLGGPFERIRSVRHTQGSCLLHHMYIRTLSTIKIEGKLHKH